MKENSSRCVHGKIPVMSAALTRQDVLRIAELARLELTPTEIDLFTTQLAGILEYVEEIGAVETAGVPLTSHAINRPIDREDEPRPTLPRHEALANAPDAAPEAGLFKVPRVIG
jgi:aspartyl-tRNA(Asn)/glutamyl-tRNA(Gln) amidotransferase subunit C